MRRRFGQSLRIGLAAHGVALVRTGRMFGSEPLALAERHGELSAPDGIVNALRAVFADDLAPAGWPVLLSSRSRVRPLTSMVRPSTRRTAAPAEMLWRLSSST